MSALTPERLDAIIGLHNEALTLLESVRLTDEPAEADRAAYHAWRRADEAYRQALTRHDGEVLRLAAQAMEARETTFLAAASENRGLEIAE